MNRSQTILVTGAPSGIGRAAALHLARRGHRVFATGRREDLLRSLEQEAAGAKLEGLVLDVTSAESIAEAKARILARTEGAGVDALVNNAGYGLMGPLEEISAEALRAQYETNVFGLVAVTQAFLPGMRARGYGRVINVSSIGGKLTAPLMGAYSSTKYAVESLSDALRVELRPAGIEVVLIEPGSIATGFAGIAASSLPDPRGSRYAPSLARLGWTLGFFDKISVGPEVIAKAIASAVESRRPSARYLRPWRTYSALWLVRLLPTRLVDFVLGRAMNLTSRALPAPRPPESLGSAARA